MTRKEQRENNLEEERKNMRNYGERKKNEVLESF